MEKLGWIACKGSGSMYVTPQDFSSEFAGG